MQQARRLPAGVRLIMPFAAIRQNAERECREVQWDHYDVWLEEDHEKT